MKSLYSFLPVVFISLFFLSCTSKGNVETGDAQKDSDDQSNTEKSANITVIEDWKMPDELAEISGISYVSEGLFACVQDEEGKIFLYNTSAAEVEREIDFAGSGDYEGISLVGDNAYVVQSDGKIYEIAQWNSENPTITEYETHLTEQHNVEGLCYDKQNNQLLLALKDGDSGNEQYKGIYAFDLATKKLSEEPFLRIDLNDPVFESIDEEKISKKFKPSEIGINPKSGDLYLTEGANAKLLIMDRSGNIKKLIKLDDNVFPQAEGISFNASGELFISNEGKKGKANILQVAIAEPVQ